MNKTPILAPSILSADFADLGGAIKKIEKEHASIIHVDVMDGSFVPPISFGQPVIKSIRGKTKLPFDVHLMVNNPEDQIESMVEAGADALTFHYETTEHIDKLIKKIKSFGKKVGIAINPETPVECLSEILFDVDIVLVMTVHPGFGGQKMILECVDKIRVLQKLKAELGLDYKVSVDGGVNGKTLKTVVNAGADIIVSGSSFFNDTLNWEF